MAIPLGCYSSISHNDESILQLLSDLQSDLEVEAGSVCTRSVDYRAWSWDMWGSASTLVPYLYMQDLVFGYSPSHRGQSIYLSLEINVSNIMISHI